MFQMLAFIFALKTIVWRLVYIASKLEIQWVIFLNGLIYILSLFCFTCVIIPKDALVDSYSLLLKGSENPSLVWLPVMFYL